MNPSVASLVYALGVAGLFFLNRDYSVRTSKALWLPVVYLWILGSRPVSFWLGATTPDVNNMQLDGSPLDGAFFGILLIAALCVLVYRRRRVLSFLNSSGPILAYFIFCLLSVIWSDFPDVAFKRWIKAIGDLLMILIVLTDKRPVAALSRLFSRTAFILVPFSLLFIKYYPYLGRTYDPWTGRQAFTGLATDKNMLGVITYVVLLGAVWRVLTLYRSDEIQPHRGRILFTDNLKFSYLYRRPYLGNWIAAGDEHAVRETPCSCSTRPRPVARISSLLDHVIGRWSENGSAVGPGRDLQWTHGHLGGTYPDGA
jgi:exopolysaccharide production protein ExoQ